jgi:hypothetical protein
MAIEAIKKADRVPTVFLTPLLRTALLFPEISAVGTGVVVVVDGTGALVLGETDGDEDGADEVGELEGDKVVVSLDDGDDVVVVDGYSVESALVLVGVGDFVVVVVDGAWVVGATVVGFAVQMLLSVVGS